MLHFSILNCICYLFDKSINMSRSASSVPPYSFFSMGHNTLVSSENFNVSPDIFRSMSFIYIRNKHGPNTDPCGTPLNTIPNGRIKL